MHEHHDHGTCAGHGHGHGCNGHHPQAMSFNEKLQTLLTHWIEHNEAHQGDYKKWSLKAREEGCDEIVAKIQEAMQLFNEGNQRLRQAQQILMMD